MPNAEELEKQSAALRLITVRGEGLTKILGTTPRVENINDESVFKRMDEKWDFQFRQLLNPTEERPKRRGIPEPTYAYDPLEQKETTPESLLNIQTELGQMSTTMTSTSLLPRDSKMTLFNSAFSASCGILYDLRLCDLKNERFVFERDAFTDNDWFFSPDSKMKDNFRSQTVNQLRTNTQLEDISESLREYNEILAGLNAKAISAILLQPPTEGQETEEQYFISRFYAISRKLYVAEHINRHLPIIILDANQGAYDYTFEQQQAELQEFIKKYPDNKYFQDLFDKNKALNEYAPVEHESNAAPQMSSSNLDNITKRRQLIKDKMLLVNEKIQLLSDLHNLGLEYEKVDDSSSTMQSLNTKKNALVESYIKNNEGLTAIDLKLDEPEAKLADSPRTKHFLQFQEDQVAEKHRRSPELAVREPEPVVSNPSFWQRNKRKIIGAAVGLLIAAIVITVSVFTFGTAPMIAALGIAGVACAAGGMGVIGFSIGAIADKIFNRTPNNKPLAHLRENLLDEQVMDLPPAKIKSSKKIKSHIITLEDESINPYKPIFTNKSTSIQSSDEKTTPTEKTSSRPRKR